MDRFKTRMRDSASAQRFCAQLQTGVETSECIIKSRIRQPVPTVERNAKFHSNQMAAGQCIAENATANEDHHEDIKLTS